MYSVNDFFRIFNFLKNNPDITIYTPQSEDEQIINFYKERRLLERELDICNTFKHLINNSVYPYESNLMQLNTISYKIYTHVTQDGLGQNEVLNLLDEYINYLLTRIDEIHILTLKYNKNPDEDYFDNYVKVLAIDCRNETIKLFQNVVDQLAFRTNDYLKIRRFIIDWYSSLKTFLKIQRFSSDAFALTDGLLEEAIKSFGFDNPEIISSKDVKAALLLSLVNIYKKKGSPYSILEFLKFLNLDYTVIYEWWLHRKKDVENGELYLKAVKLGQYKQYEQDIHQFERILPWHEFEKEAGCHWFYTEEEIKALDDKLDYLDLPSIIPYFSLAVFFNQEEVKTSLSFFNSICNYLYIKHIQSDISEDKVIYVNEFNQYYNILEIYLGLLYSYNRYNDYVKYLELKEFIKEQYRIDPEKYEPKPFTGKWPFQYEKLVHWAITTKDYDDQLMTLNGFNLYPLNTEINPQLQNINQNENLDINFDNDLNTEFEFIQYLPYILNNKDSNQQRVLSYRNIYENIYDIYNVDAYDAIYKNEYEQFITKLESYKDIHYIYTSKQELIENKDILPNNTICLVRKDESLDHYHKYQCSLYKVENGELKKIDNDNYDYYKYIKNIDNYKQFRKEWTLLLKDNFSKCITDAERLLNGEMPERVDYRYNLPLSDNQIDDLILVKKDETRYFLPALYRCKATSGSIDDQWEYVENGLSKINFGINTDLIKTIEDFILDDPTKYYEAAEIFSEYINIFINTYITNNNFNIKELLLGQAQKIEKILEAVKPLRARLFSYDSVNHIDSPSEDSAIPIDVFNDEIIQRVPNYPLREPIRNDIENNFDKSEYIKFDRPHIYDHLEIIPSDLDPCIIMVDDEIVYLENEPLFETDLPIIGQCCCINEIIQNVNVYNENDKVMNENDEVFAEVKI